MTLCSTSFKVVEQKDKKWTECFLLAPSDQEDLAPSNDGILPLIKLICSSTPFSTALRSHLAKLIFIRQTTRVHLIDLRSSLKFSWKSDQLKSNTSRDFCCFDKSRVNPLKMCWQRRTCSSSLFLSQNFEMTPGRIEIPRRRKNDTSRNRFNSRETTEIVINLIRKDEGSIQKPWVFICRVWVVAWWVIRQLVCLALSLCIFVVVMFVFLTLPFLSSVPFPRCLHKWYVMVKRIATRKWLVPVLAWSNRIKWTNKRTKEKSHLVGRWKRV